MQPLILTLALDEHSQRFFDTQRQQYFPAERNHLKAHLTLFHHLPPDELHITSVIEAVCAEQPMMDLQVAEVRHTGNGVAYKMESTPLIQLHRRLQKEWQSWLIPQDQHTLWPHITVQNKVDPMIAAELKNELAQDFSPFIAYGTGFNLWEYLGGPWRFIQYYEFNG